MRVSGENAINSDRFFYACSVPFRDTFEYKISTIY